MDNPRPEKVAVVEEVRQHFDGASAAILTEYRGLTVKDLAGLRRSVRASGGEYKIYKNTLVRLAARESGLGDLSDLLVGPVGITFVNGDAAAVAKVLRDFGRTNPLLVIKGGVLGDKVIDARETSALADLPSREVLLARLAGGIAAPLQQFAGLLQALPRNLAYGLAALRDKRESEGGAAAAAPAPAAEGPAVGAPATEGPAAEASAAEPAAEAPATEEQAAASAVDALPAEAPATEEQAAEATAAEPTAADESSPVQAATDPDPAAASTAGSPSTESESES